LRNARCAEQGRSAAILLEECGFSSKAQFKTHTGKVGFLKKWRGKEAEWKN